MKETKNTLTLKRNAIFCDIDLFIQNCVFQGIEVSCEDISTEFGISNSEAREAINLCKKGAVKHPEDPHAFERLVDEQIYQWDLMYPDQP